MDTSPFMRQVRDVLRFKQMALTTEKTYCYWIRFFIRQQKFASPDDIQQENVTAFLTWLAVERKVSPNTQNQALKSSYGGQCNCQGSAKR